MTNQSVSVPDKKRSFGQVLHAFFFNRRTLAVFSLLISLAMWTLVKTNATQESTRTFTDIPITIKTADIFTNFGLEKIAIVGPPSAVSEKVRVIATGSTYNLSQIQAGDITVVATQLGSVTRADTVRLALSVSCTNPNIQVSLPSSENYIIVRFDQIKEMEFAIDKPIAVGASVSSGSELLIGEAFCPVKSIVVKGPETEMSAISSVELTADVGKELADTEAFPARLIFRDKNGGELKFLGDDDQGYVRIIKYTDQDGEHEGTPPADILTITVPISKTAELTTAITIKKAPSSFDKSTLKYTISPQTLKLGGQVDAINKLAETGKYELDEGIDLSSLSAYNSVHTLKLNLSSGVTDAGGLSEVTVTFDLAGYADKLFTLQKDNPTVFKLVNVPEGMNAVLISDKLENVTVTGPDAKIQNLWEKDCVIEVDMSAVDAASGQKLVAATITFPDFPSCWAVGSYQVRVQIE